MDRAHVVAAVDDHPVMLRGLASFLGEESGIELRLIAATCDELLALDLGDVDVVLLDVDLGDGSDVEDNVTRILAAGPRVILYTNEHRPVVVRAALRAGALGLVLKGDPESHVVEAIESAAAGEHYVSSRLAMQLVNDPAGAVHLSQREQEVLERLALGLPYPALAADLGIAVTTARTHVQHAMDAYAEAGITLRGGPREAVARSIRAGHIDPFRP
ncbi:response regulator transcription factor [Miniimonas arenae]|uniref:Response regulator transcription factor n=1 Tax=Miniimonas arenae TaxID=676201 RepID=A0A5C5BCC0_9MICO|nr:response regulator transcription factor [Miniimonas arenae]TNU74863.1 response regulator transcription factor [Miniimonas arenae]